MKTGYINSAIEKGGEGSSGLMLLDREKSTKHLCAAEAAVLG